jgi:hypothetical protein
MYDLFIYYHFSMVKSNKTSLHPTHAFSMLIFVAFCDKHFFSQHGQHRAFITFPVQKHWHIKLGIGNVVLLKVSVKNLFQHIMSLLKLIHHSAAYITDPCITFRKLLKLAHTNPLLVWSPLPAPLIPSP